MISKGWTPEYLINSTSVVEHSEGNKIAPVLVTTKDLTLLFAMQGSR